jgi:hypothetical protein
MFMLGKVKKTARGIRSLPEWRGQRTFQAASGAKDSPIERAPEVTDDEFPFDERC